MTFGERFKQLRLESGLKQQELVDEFNQNFGYSFSKSSISQYENNKKKPEVNALRDFAIYFNVSIDYLLGNDENIDDTHHIKGFKSLCKNSAASVFSDENISREEKDELFKELSNLYFNSLK